MHPRLSLVLAGLLVTADIGARGGDEPSPPPPAQFAMAFAPAPPAGHRRLRVLSYNVNGLPWTNPGRRYVEIARELRRRRAEGTGPDFVVLQEVFFGPVEVLTRGSGYRYVAAGPTGGVGASSGLYVLSDHPFVREERMAFDACRWTDCFARKGALAVWARVAGLPAPVTVVTTHMQAWREYDRTRVAQIDELARFLDGLHADPRLTVFAGDVNTRAHYDSYAYLLSRTHLLDAGRVCLDRGAQCQAGGGSELWSRAIDRQFTHDALRPVATDWRFREPVQGRPLSDHWGYEVEYEARWP